MRALGVDHGAKRIGLAVSDPTGTIATAWGCVEGGGLEKTCAAVLAAAKELGVGIIVVGVPWQMNGQPSNQTARVLEFIAMLEQATTLPVVRWDERLTTKQAERVLIEGRVRRQNRKDKVDMVAAQMLLQNWLESQREKQPL